MIQPRGSTWEKCLLWTRQKSRAKSVPPRKLQRYILHEPPCCRLFPLVREHQGATYHVSFFSFHCYSISHNEQVQHCRAPMTPMYDLFALQLDAQSCRLLRAGLEAFIFSTEEAAFANTLEIHHRAPDTDMPVSPILSTSQLCSCQQ